MFVLNDDTPPFRVLIPFWRFCFWPSIFPTEAFTLFVISSEPSFICIIPWERLLVPSFKDEEPSFSVLSPSFSWFIPLLTCFELLDSNEVPSFSLILPLFKATLPVYIWFKPFDIFSVWFGTWFRLSDSYPTTSLATSLSISFSTLISPFSISCDAI